MSKAHNPDVAEDQEVAEDLEVAEDTEDLEVVEDPEDNDQEFDRDRALSTIREQRAAEKRLKAELRAAQKRLKAIDDAEAARVEAEKTEIEKAKAEAAKLKADLEREKQVVSALRMKAEFSKVTEAEGLRFTSQQAAEDAWDLADLDGVELSEDGKVKGMKEAVIALSKSRPYLFSSATDNKNNNGTPPRDNRRKVSGDKQVKLNVGF